MEGGGGKGEGGGGGVDGQYLDGVKGECIQKRKALDLMVVEL